MLHEGIILKMSTGPDKKRLNFVIPNLNAT